MKPKHYYYTPAYCGLRCLNITLHVLLLVSIVTYPQHLLSITRCLLEHIKQQQVTRLKLETYNRKLFVSERYLNNVRVVSYTVGISFIIVCCSWSLTLLCQCGDIHPNPGPVNVDPRNSDHTNQLYNKLSILHYNVQSISKKIDVI